jgi:hypothetical protein
MHIPPRLIRFSSVLKTSLTLAVLVAIIPLVHGAEVATLGFTDENGATSFDQYPGTASGGGWDTAWALNTAVGGTGATTAIVSHADPIGAGGRYLAVTSTATTDSALNRSFDGTMAGQLITAPYRVIFDFRVDALASFNTATSYITITDNVVNSAGSINTGSSFIIRAHGAMNGTAKALVWSFYDGEKNNGAFKSTRFSSSTMGLTAGTTYSFVIDVYPASRTYNVSIDDGTFMVVAKELGFRKSTARGGDYLVFNTKNNPSGGSISYSLDNISVSPISER